MKTHVEELVEKWQRETSLREPKYGPNFEDGYMKALWGCWHDLKDALLLDEADKVR